MARALPFSALAIALVVSPLTTACGLLLNGAECAADGDCSSSDICLDGTCVECAEDADCDDDEECNDGDCERASGEGEGEAGEGEGEGEAGEGEGEAGEGEGEGEAGEGEGEGEAGEGEGEGEGELQIPPTGMAFELRWESATADIDLHATEGGAGPFCVEVSGTSAVTVGPISQACDAATNTNDDCTFASCRAGVSGAPDWDDNGTRNDADPVLQVDDLDGLGPEITTVAAPVAGNYLLGAHAYNLDDVSTTVTMRVFDDGAIESTITGTLAGDNDWLDMAIVHVNAQGAVTCVGDITDGVDECPQEF